MGPLKAELIVNRAVAGVSLNTHRTGGQHAMTSQQAVSYWLMPCPQARDDFEALSKLACRGLQGCTLSPHITLYSDHLDGAAGAVDRLSQSAEGWKPLWLRPISIEAGLLFTMSLIVRFAAGEKLIPWFMELRRRSPNRLDYQLEPHLSLLYSSQALSARQATAARLTLPGPALFDRLAVVIHPLTISTDADIAAVTTLDQRTLA